MDICYIRYQGKITVQINNTLQFAHISKKLNVSPAKRHEMDNSEYLFFTLKIIMDVCNISYQGKITVQIDIAHVSKKLNVSPANLT